MLHSIERTPLWRVLPIVERELGLPDVDIGYRFQPSHEIINVRENRARVSTNALGMRDQPRTVDKPPNTFRVAVMGDSFTEALQVDLRTVFTTQAEVKLNATHSSDENHARRYEVLNFGMSGFGPLQQLLHYKNNAQTFAPDLALFVIGINDFLSAELSNDASGPAYVETGNGELEIGYGFRHLTSHRIGNSPVGQLFFWAMDNSRVARAAFLKVKVGNSSTGTSSSRGSSCQGFGNQLLAQTRLWSDLQPEPSARRLEKLLTDIRSTNISSIAPTPISFAIYGLLVPPAQCESALAARKSLVGAITAKLASYDITLVDLENGLVDFDQPQYMTRGLQGFGTALGRGHLNTLGHEAFANILVEHIFQRSN